MNYVKLKYAEYSALSPKDIDTMYYIEDKGAIYIGAIAVARNTELWVGTQAEYNALSNIDNNKFYYLSDKGGVKKGTQTVERNPEIIVVTQAQYDAMVPEEGKKYYISDTGSVAKGSHVIDWGEHDQPVPPGPIPPTPTEWDTNPMSSAQAENLYEWEVLVYVN